MDTYAVLWALVAGTAVGVLATGLAHAVRGATGARSRVPLWLAILCGIAGVVAGDAVYTRLWVGPGAGVDWWRHACQVGAALVVVSLVAVVPRLRGLRLPQVGSSGSPSPEQ